MDDHGGDGSLEGAGDDAALYLAYLIFSEGAHRAEEQGTGTQVAVSKFVNDAVHLRVLRFLLRAEERRVLLFEVAAHHVRVHLVQVAEGGEVRPGIPKGGEVAGHEVSAGEGGDGQQAVCIGVGGEQRGLYAAFQCRIGRYADGARGALHL